MCKLYSLIIVNLVVFVGAGVSVPAISAPMLIQKMKIKTSVASVSQKTVNLIPSGRPQSLIVKGRGLDKVKSIQVIKGNLVTRAVLAKIRKKMSQRIEISLRANAAAKIGTDYKLRLVLQKGAILAPVKIVVIRQAKSKAKLQTGRLSSSRAIKAQITKRQQSRKRAKKETNKFMKQRTTRLAGRHREIRVPIIQAEGFRNEAKHVKVDTIRATGFRGEAKHIKVPTIFAMGFRNEAKHVSVNTIRATGFRGEAKHIKVPIIFAMGFRNEAKHVSVNTIRATGFRGEAKHIKVPTIFAMGFRNEAKHVSVNTIRATGFRGEAKRIMVPTIFATGFRRDAKKVNVPVIRASGWRGETKNINLH